MLAFSSRLQTTHHARLELHPSCFILFFCWVACSLTTARAEKFPPEAKVINLVTDLGAVGDGKTDNTEVFRKMVDIEGLSYYLPDGVYIISDSILYGARIWKILEGQSRDGTIIKLQDNAPGFQDKNKPKPMFVTGSPPAIRFRTSMRSLTFDTGKGNPGAIGLNFYVNNQGAVRNVRIRSGDGGSEPAHTGLAMTLDMVGPLLIRDLLVEGFDTGIDIKHSVNSVTLENIVLRGQKQVGIQNWQNLVFLRKLDFEGDVVAIRNGGQAGVFLLADSVVKGTGNASQKPGVEITHDGSNTFVLRSDIQGYKVAIQHAPSGEEVASGKIEEWCSDPPAMLHAGVGRMLNLPVKELPELPWESDFSKWADVTKFGANPYDDEDDAPAIQAAIDSGATVVFFPQAVGEPKKKKPAYIFGSTIVLRGNVNHIFGNEQYFKIGAPLLVAPPEKGEASGAVAVDKPVFRLDPKGPKLVIIERLGKHLGQGYDNPFLILDVDRDVLLSSSSGLHHVIQKGPGVLYADDIVGPAWKVHKGAEVYAWQFNLEGDSDYKIDNDGGLVWCLGLKTEHRGPTILTRNGGRTEVLGAHLYTCVGTSVDKGQIFVEDASFAMAAGSEYAWTRSWATEELLIDTRNGDRRSYRTGAFAPRSGGSQLPFVSLIKAEPPGGAAPATPTVEKQEIHAESVNLSLTSTDADGDLAGFEITRAGEMPSFKQSPRKNMKEGEKLYTMTEGHVRGLVKPGHRFTESGLRPETEYEYTVVAYDRANRRSEPLTLKVKTTADQEPPAKIAEFWSYQVFDTEAQLRFKPTTDNVGVNHYLIQRLEGDQVSREAKIEAKDVGQVFTWTDDQVTKGAKYIYRAVAVDHSGNPSPPTDLAIEIPTQPPSERIVEMESFEGGVAPPRKAPGHIFSMMAWSGFYIPDVDFGKEKPFNRATLRYGVNPNQAGTILDVFIGGELKEGAFRWTDVVGGTHIGSFPLVSTGGYDKMKEITIPLENVPPGKHTLTFRVRKGNSKAFNAAGNLDKITLSRFDSEAKQQAAIAEHKKLLAEIDVPEGINQQPPPQK